MALIQMHRLYLAMQGDPWLSHAFAPDPELIMDFLTIELAAGYQVIHLLYALAGFTAVLWIWNFLSRRTTLKHTAGHLAIKLCHACGWSGGASAHQKRCPKCNATLI